MRASLSDMPSRHLDEVVASVCRIALDGGNTSDVTLLERSGYLERRDEITVELLRDRLASEPSLIEAWQTWCEDDRSSPMWYFRTIGPGASEVVYVENGRRALHLEFADRTQACAEYLIRELDLIASARDVWRRPWAAFGRWLVGRFRPPIR